MCDRHGKPTNYEGGNYKFTMCYSKVPLAYIYLTVNNNDACFINI